MKILHWTEAYWPHIGGVGVFTRELAAQLHANGHQNKFLTNQLGDLPDQAVVDGSVVQRLPFSQNLEARDLAGILRLSGKVREIVADFNPDVIHLHTSQSGAFYFLRLMNTLNLPTIYTSYDPIVFDDSASPLLKSVLEKVTNIVAVSDFMKSRILKLSPGVSGKIRTIYMALNEPPISPAPLNIETPQLFCAANLIENKGIDVVLRSLPKVLQQYPGVRFVIAGDGPARAALEQLAGELGISKHVNFLGWVEPQDIPALINRAAIILVPTRWAETFGLVALQAMQLSRPVIASRIGGIPEAFEDEVHGLLVEPDDPEGVSKALLKLLANPAKAVQMGRMGYAHVRTKFSWERCLAEYVELYREGVT